MVAVQRHVRAGMRYEVAFILWIIKLRQSYPANESRFIRQQRFRDGKRKARAGFAKVIGAKKEIVNAWLPGVHKLSSNSKAWVIGTHHGGNSDYLESYLAEYFYRFNRRHDPKRLFHRAVRACVLAQPRTNGTLFG